MKLNLSLKFITSITVLVLTIMGLTFGLILEKHRQLVMAQIEMQAKALFRQVVITRKWVSDHGGIFVEKLPWVETNPFLHKPTITDVHGKRYVKENPAMVTKQLSEYAEKEKLYFFHITSLKLVNPANAPDRFEEEALRNFESGRISEASGTEKIGKTWYFRYIAPLYVEKKCLECHSHQGYRPGDIRGAISVSVPMDYAIAMEESERKYMILGFIVIGGVLVGGLFMMTRRIVIKPIRMIQDQVDRFSKKGGSEISVVRTGDEIEELSASFREMSLSLNEYHSGLQDKIRAATRELTEKNEELTRSYERKSGFISAVSHELRTPLTAIKGATDYLSVKLSMKASGEDADVTEFLDMIKRSSDRLIRLVRDVLDFERLELGAFDMEFRPVDLKAALQEIISGLKPLADEKRVEIKLIASEITACADEDRIKQVMTNLISNALNFSPESSQITITVKNQGAFALVSVDDMGPGVPQDERRLIFGKFYTRKVSGGTGLGLAICKGIIAAHRGEIGVTDSESGGSRFWFSIPLNRNEADTVEEKTSCD